MVWFRGATATWRISISTMRHLFLGTCEEHQSQVVPHIFDSVGKSNGKGGNVRKGKRGDGPRVHENDSGH